MEIVRKERQERARHIVLILKCGHEVTLEGGYRGWEISCHFCDSVEIRKRKAQEKVFLTRKKKERLIPAY